jgi:DNA-binding winged helix-turn-helix (wHTH) protein
MDEPVQSLRWARFGAELDLKAGELHASGRRIRLQNQPFQLLMLLLEHAGEVVTPGAIRTKLWASDTIVEFELSIGTAVKKLRHALGDDATTPRYIETLPRRGYRWLVPVIWEDARAAGASGLPRVGVPATGWVGAAAEVAAPAQGRLVGRARSLDALHDSLRRALRHERQLVFITGEPGVRATRMRTRGHD